MKKRIYNISSSRSFVDVLAKRFLAEYEQNPLGLAEVLFLLPNRRAVRSLKDAFVRAKGLVPTLLPRMIPLGDVEEDELFLTGGSGRDVLSGMEPAIGTTERLLLFVKLIMSKPNEFGMEKMSLNQACFLAQELSRLVDMANNLNLPFDNLEKLVPDDFAAHWQETLKFLKIVTDFWPHILAERGLIDASTRRNRLLLAQSRIWKQNPPSKRIVAAGTTAAFPAMKELLQMVLELPQGEIYLAGLDKKVDEETWSEVDETHPQFELKELLDCLGLERGEIENIGEAANVETEAWISEIMRPAKVSDRWLDLPFKHIKPASWSGVQLINCTEIREEALAIALIMRETLEHEGKTAALVTTDRNLARRVSAELERWNVKVDDSAGKPLALSPIGIYLRLLIQCCCQNARKSDLLALFKNPLTAMGKDYGEIRRLTRQLEKNVWRGKKTDEAAQNLAELFTNLSADLRALLEKSQVNFKDLLQQHIETAEKLAATDQKEGAQVLWRGDDGEAAAQFVADLFEQADVLGDIDPQQYAGLLDALMMAINVRPKFGMHPRLKILGPIEARLNRFDVTIIGEANEGIWPQAASADPWMSRPMKKDFGFPLPERAIGVMAFDFSQQLAGDEVYLTRAERVQGTPMVKSRWWLRLETVLKALKVEPETVENLVYRLWSRQLDQPQKMVKLEPPAPCPPLESRPKQLSASAIEMLMRDPYAVFARYILRLRPLEEVDQDLTMADYGTIIHAVLQEFNNRYPSKLPPNAREELLKLGDDYFQKNEIAAETCAFWWPNFIKSVDWILEQEKTYRPQVAKVYNELAGSLPIDTPRGFTVTAIADRVDETADGRVNIIDYKTGRARTEKEVRSWKAPQLPIEGLIAAKGGFGNLPAREVDKLIYWQLAKQQVEISGNMSELLERSYQNLSELINLFEFETTPYLSRPNPKTAPDYSDYEHLARVREWSIISDEEEK